MQPNRLIFLGLSYISTLGGRFSSVDSQHCPMSVSGKSASMSQIPDYKPGNSSIAFVTTPDETSAKKIAHSLISKKLAACVNIIPKVTSIYEWEGKVNEDSEYLMMIKTRTSRVAELTAFVRENHPYSVAEVITVPIENGNAPYLDWIAKSVPEK